MKVDWNLKVSFFWVRFSNSSENWQFFLVLFNFIFTLVLFHYFPGWSRQIFSSPEIETRSDGPSAHCTKGAEGHLAAIKELELKADYSPPSSAEDNPSSIYSSTSLCTFKTLCFISHRSKFSPRLYIAKTLQ